MTARAAIVVFPGSNCEGDCARALGALGVATELVWHTDEGLPDCDLVVVPGGFAHGDYLRTGAIARFSPVMGAVRAHAAAGKLVIGICNGWQILCEAGLLPGALRRNSGLKFVCKWTDIRVANAATPFSTRAEEGQVLRVPVNHFEGNWYCDRDVLSRVHANRQIVFRYADNPNGALDDVAGLTNEAGNVLGMMPHPERASEALLGSEDGRLILGSMLDHVSALAPA
ncbi:MAG: phosphoribosylformylglycinamidine synthase subunit PurQ [Actinobacteria bacterium]|nr:phosphoribosylformylglycinamidine synthase subunit PurQ [Actinomycetota bacterium]